MALEQRADDAKSGPEDAQDGVNSNSSFKPQSDGMEGVLRSKAIWMMYFMIFLYALSWQLQRPLEPFLVEKLVGTDKASESALFYGYLNSFFSLVQTVGSLIFGSLLDRIGVRKAFFVAFLCSGMTFYIQSLADSITWLFISKVPSIFASGFMTAQLATVNLTTPEHAPNHYGKKPPKNVTQLTALGRLTTAYTVGGMLGPFLGGQLGAQGEWGYAMGAQLAALLMVVAAFMALLCLPLTVDTRANKHSSPPPSPVSLPTSDSLSSSPSSSSFFSLVNVLALLLFVKIISGVGNSMMSSIRPLILKNQLGFDEAGLGTMMSVQFAFGGFASGFLLQPLAALLGGHTSAVVRNCLLLTCAGLLAQTLLVLDASPVDSTWRGHAVIVLSFFLATLQYTLSTSLTAETMGSVTVALRGKVMGLTHSLFALARVVGPALGTVLLLRGGLSAVSAGTACVYLLLVVVWVWHRRDIPVKGVEDTDDKEKSH